MLNYNQAYDIVKKEIAQIKLTTEQIDILESTGRYLAEDIYPDMHLPSFSNSAMDGYALRYDYLRSKYRIIGEIKAGDECEYELQADECVSIMTGAKVPDSADTVIPIEDVIIDDNFIVLRDSAINAFGDHIRFQGDDLNKDSIALKSRSKINSNQIPLLATCGKKFIKVFRKIKIGVLTTGSELIDIEKMPVKSQIRASNLYSILENVTSLNQHPINYGFIEDDKELLKAKISQILNDDIDILITSGAVSVGKYDFIHEVLAELHCETIFWQVNIKPGKPLLFSHFIKNDRKILILGLPGNPVSSFVNFKIFAERAINDYFGNTKLDYFTAELTEPITKSDGKRHFIRAVSFYDEIKNKTFAKLTKQHTSGNLYGLSKSNCLIEMPETVEIYNQGAIVKCIRI